MNVSNLNNIPEQKANFLTKCNFTLKTKNIFFSFSPHLPILSFTQHTSLHARTFLPLLISYFIQRISINYQ